MHDDMGGMAGFDWQAARCQAAEQEVERLTAELAALRKDAERYRWLRDHATVGTVHLQTPDGWAHYRSAADEVVDVAMAAAPGVGAA